MQTLIPRCKDARQRLGFPSAAALPFTVLRPIAPLERCTRCFSCAFFFDVQ